MYIGDKDFNKSIHIHIKMLEADTQRKMKCKNMLTFGQNSYMECVSSRTAQKDKLTEMDFSLDAAT